MNLSKTVLLGCINILYFLFVEGMFHVEEMKLLNYEVDISLTPVKKEEVTQPVVFITSKSGQEFQCSLPQLIDEEVTEKEITNEKEQDVLELLKPMRSSSCLLKTKDWWTYEFCFGHYIKQYHVEEGRILGQVLTLGLYDSDYDWNNETDQEKFKHVKQKYHSQYYANGTKCDLTGQPRTAEVRFYCGEDAGDYIHRVDEPGTCSYVIIVQTSRLCSHPQLKPSPRAKLHSIPCHPVLDEEQYTKYLQKMKEGETEAEDKRNKMSSDQKEHLLLMKKGNVLVDANTETENLLNKVPDAEPTLSNEEKYNFKVSLIKQYLKAIQKLQTSPKVSLPSVKVEIQKQFEKIFDEAKKDFGSDFMEENKAITRLKLLALLNTQIEMLENAKSDLLLTLNELRRRKMTTSESQTYESSKVANSEKVQRAVQDDEDSKLKFLVKRLNRKYSDDSSKLHDLDLERRTKMEQFIKEKLAADNEGHTVEVKIISGGFLNGDEEGKSFKSFNDEEMAQFQNMIMTLVTGQKEAVHEMERHKKLEESYEFTWSDSEEIDKKED